MPFLQPKVAEYMFSQAEGVEVAVPMWPNGRLETLMMVLERPKQPRNHGNTVHLETSTLRRYSQRCQQNHLVSPINHIKTLDPELKSFININSKEDLNRLQTRHSHGPVTENMQLNLGILSISDLRLIREGAKMFQERQGFGCTENICFLCEQL